MAAGCLPHGPTHETRPMYGAAGGGCGCVGRRRPLPVQDWYGTAATNSMLRVILVNWPPLSVHRSAPAAGRPWTGTAGTVGWSGDGPGTAGWSGGPLDGLGAAGWSGNSWMVRDSWMVWGRLDGLGTAGWSGGSWMVREQLDGLGNSWMVRGQLDGLGTAGWFEYSRLVTVDRRCLGTTTIPLPGH